MIVNGRLGELLRSQAKFDYFGNVAALLSNHVPVGASQPVGGHSISEQLERSIKAGNP